MSPAPNRVNLTTPRAADRFVGLSEAADYYGISQRSIRRLIAEGQLPAYRVGKRQIRIKVSDLDALATPIPSASC